MQRLFDHEKLEVVCYGLFWAFNVQSSATIQAKQKAPSQTEDFYLMNPE